MIATYKEHFVRTPQLLSKEVGEDLNAGKDMRVFSSENGSKAER